MQTLIEGGIVTVVREAKDRKYGKNESLFFYDLKKAIKEQHNVDVVKKLAYKDGHLLDNLQYYIRERKGEWCILDNQHALRSCSEVYSKEGEVKLSFVWLVNKGGTL